MKKHSINMFQIPPLMVFEYEGDMNKLLEHISNIEYVNRDRSRSEDDYVLDDDNLKELRQFCLDSVYEYVDEVLGIDDEIEIQQSWINVSHPGEQHSEHYHPQSFISGVFYLVSDQEKGAPIVFKSELHKNNFSVQKLPKDPYLTYYPCTANTYNYPSIPGQLLLFSSNTSHLVPANASDKERVSLSFNTFPKLPFGNKQGLAYLRG
tara:strand:- start:59 stop:679 length:621 start_codon:yes stop_codon:yes gene_type:complete